MNFVYKNSFITLGFLLILMGCSTDAEPTVENEIPIDSSCSMEGLLENFTDENNNNLYIYEDGKVYLSSDGNCEFELQYFDPEFETQNYIKNASGTFLKDDSELIPIRNNFSEDFEKPMFTDLFSAEISDPNLFWTSFTLQSPQAKTVSEYVALSKCILEDTCDFLDNRITIVEDPVNSSNKVVEFKSVAPTTDMVVSKCSMSSVLGYFKKSDDIWFEADYYIKEGMPITLVDFENSYFVGSPGPRVVISNGELEFENKFGAKLQFESNSGNSIPTGEWFTIKVHLRFSNTEDGILELWQDGSKIISTTGVNLPTSNSIQNNIEVGISATLEDTILLMDNIKVSDTTF